MTRRAIVFGVHPWGGPFQLGAHHLARALAREGWDILYVAAPLSPPHLAGVLSPALRRRWGEVFAPPTGGEVRVLAPFTFTPLSAHLGANNDTNLAHWPRATFPSLTAKLKSLGFERPDLAILDGPLQLAAARLAAPHKLVLRMFDRFGQMPGMTPALLRLAAEAAGEADLVVCSAHDLQADAQALGARRVLLLENGVDVQHFAAQTPTPALYAKIPAPRAVYVGQTKGLFDPSLVARIAVERPAISFVIIGPTAPIRGLSGAPNVYLIGPRSWWELPSYLEHADVGLIPFDSAGQAEYAAGVQPLKLYEYLAAGLPVVSAPWAELERIAAPNLILAPAERYAEAIDVALTARPSKSSLRAFAAAADWRMRARALLRALD